MSQIVIDTDQNRTESFAERYQRYLQELQGRKESCNWGCRVRIAFDTSLPKERPTQDTSRLCVNRL